ncbi:AI-2E family transporter [Enterococcus faecalis]
MDKESTKWIRFLGGKNLLYTLTILCLIAVTIFLFNTVSFIFKPIFVIFSAVLGPVLFGIILFYLLNPMVKRLEKKIPRVWAIAILYVLIIALLVLGWTATFPNYPRPNGRINQTIPKFLEKHAPNSTRIYG